MKRVAIVLLVLTSFPAWGFGDRIVLNDGRTFEGIVTQADGKVFVEMAYGTISFPASEIHSIERMPTPSERLESQLSRIDRADADAVFELAVWAQGVGLSTRGRRLLQDVIALNGDHAEARRLLGQIKADGKWIAVAAGVQLARAKLQAGKHGALQTDLLPALKAATSDAKLALEIEDIEAHTRLGAKQFAKAAKAFADLAVRHTGPAAVRYATIAKILTDHPKGMYVVVEAYPPTADLFGAAEPAVKPGPASLARPEVLKVALRDAARAAVKLGQTLLNEGKKLELTEPEAAKAKYALAEKRFDTADALLARIAFNYRVEIARRRIGMVSKAMTAEAAKFDQLMGLLGQRDMTPAAYRDLILRMMRALNNAKADIETMLQLAGPFQRELAIEIIDIKLRLQRVDKLRAVLTKELHGR